MLTIKEYERLATTIIRKYSPPEHVWKLDRSPDCHDLVIEYLMNADATFDPTRGTSPSSWRVSNGRWAIYNHLRNIDRPYAEVSLEEEPYDTADDPERRACRFDEQADDFRRLRGLLSGLTDMQRHCFVLHHIDGLIKKDVGLRLGISRQCASYTIDAAMRRLRSLAGGDAMNATVVLAACEPGGLFIVDEDGDLPRLFPDPWTTARDTALAMLRAACGSDIADWVTLIPVGFRDDDHVVDLIFSVAFPEPFPLAAFHQWKNIIELTGTDLDVARRAIYDRN